MTCWRGVWVHVQVGAGPLAADCYRRPSGWPASRSSGGGVFTVKRGARVAARPRGTDSQPDPTARGNRLRANAPFAAWELVG